jgi:hypothetical protein
MKREPGVAAPNLHQRAQARNNAIAWLRRPARTDLTLAAAGRERADNRSFFVKGRAWPAVHVFDLAPNRTWMPGTPASAATPFFERPWPDMALRREASCALTNLDRPEGIV